MIHIVHWIHLWIATVCVWRLLLRVNCGMRRKSKREIRRWIVNDCLLGLNSSQSKNQSINCALNWNAISTSNIKKTIRRQSPLDRLLVEVENVFVSNDQNFRLQSLSVVLFGRMMKIALFQYCLQTRVQTTNTPKVKCKTKTSLATVESLKRNAMCDYSTEKEKRFNLSAFYSSSACFAFLFSFSSKKESTVKHDPHLCKMLSFFLRFVLHSDFDVCFSCVSHPWLMILCYRFFFNFWVWQSYCKCFDDREKDTRKRGNSVA